MKKLFALLFAVVLAIPALAQLIQPSATYNRTTLVFSPTNLMASNILAGSGVTMAKDGYGRLTFTFAGLTIKSNGVTISTNTILNLVPQTGVLDILVAGSNVAFILDGTLSGLATTLPGGAGYLRQTSSNAFDIGDVSADLLQDITDVTGHVDANAVLVFNQNPTIHGINVTGDTILSNVTVTGSMSWSNEFKPSFKFWDTNLTYFIELQGADELAGPVVLNLPTNAVQGLFWASTNVGSSSNINMRLLPAGSPGQALLTLGDGTFGFGTVATTNVTVTNTLFVMKNGNDASAVPGNLSQPFATVTNAVKQLKNSETIHIYPGVYNVNADFMTNGEYWSGSPAPILLANLTNIAIIGHGFGSEINSGNSYGDMIAISNCQGVILRDFALIGTNPYPNVVTNYANCRWAGIHFLGVNKNIYIDNLRVANHAWHAISDLPYAGIGHKSGEVFIRNCRFENIGSTNIPIPWGAATNYICEGAVAHGNMSTWRFEFNYITNALRGIELYHTMTTMCKNLFVVNNSFKGILEKAIYLRSMCEDISIQNNDIGLKHATDQLGTNITHYGISLATRERDVRIINNNIYSQDLVTNGVCISLLGGTLNNTNVMIANNNLGPGDMTGISLFELDFVLYDAWTLRSFNILYNSFFGLLQPALSVQGYDVLIRGNAIVNCGSLSEYSVGFLMGSPSNTIRFVENRISHPIAGRPDYVFDIGICSNALFIKANVIDSDACALYPTIFQGSALGYLIYEPFGPGITAATNSTLTNDFLSWNGLGWTNRTVPLLTNANTIFVSKNGNDTTAVRGDPLKPFASVTNAFTALQSGDTLIMYPGTYYFNPGIGTDYHRNSGTPLALCGKSNVTIKGFGWNTVLHGGTNFGDFIAISNCQNLTFMDFSLVGTNREGALSVGDANANWAAFHLIGTNQNLTFFNLNFDTHMRQGISDLPDAAIPSLATEVSVRNCRFVNLGSTNNPNGQSWDGACIAGFLGNWRFEFNFVSNCLRGVEVYHGYSYPCSDVQITGNSFLNIWEHAIYVIHRVNTLNIQNNYFRMCYASVSNYPAGGRTEIGHDGIYLCNGVTDVRILNNHFEWVNLNMVQSAIGVGATAALGNNSTNIVIGGNHFGPGPGSKGIVFFDATGSFKSHGVRGLKILDNSFENLGHYAVDIAAYDPEIAGNTFVNCGLSNSQAPVRFFWGDAYNTIRFRENNFSCPSATAPPYLFYFASAVGNFDIRQNKLGTNAYSSQLFSNTPTGELVYEPYGPGILVNTNTVSVGQLLGWNGHGWTNVSAAVAGSITVSTNNTALGASTNLDFIAGTGINLLGTSNLTGTNFIQINAEAPDWLLETNGAAAVDIATPVTLTDAGSYPSAVKWDYDGLSLYGYVPFNTRTTNGSVPGGDTYTNRLWQTDGNANPGWRSLIELSDSPVGRFMYAVSNAGGGDIVGSPFMFQESDYIVFSNNAASTRLKAKSAVSSLVISPTSIGTESADMFELAAGGSVKWDITTGGAFQPVTDYLQDIGQIAGGNFRPRTIHASNFVGQAMNAGTLVSTNLTVNGPFTNSGVASFGGGIEVSGTGSNWIDALITTGHTNNTQPFQNNSTFTNNGAASISGALDVGGPVTNRGATHLDQSVTLADITYAMAEFYVAGPVVITNNLTLQAAQIFATDNAVPFIPAAAGTGTTNVFKVDGAYAERTIIMTNNVYFTNSILNAPASGVTFPCYTLTNASDATCILFFDAALKKWASSAATNIVANKTARISFQILNGGGNAAYGYIVEQ